VAKSFIEFAAVFIIFHLENAVLDAKCVAEILACGISFDLGSPPVQIAAVEELDPISVGRIGEGRARETHKY
jgi:hypothetical protein